jgi:hypothetical protein
VYTKIKAGIETKITLPLSTESARSVMLYSSDRRHIYMPNKELNRAFKLIPHTINPLQVCARTFTQRLERTRVHAVGKDKIDDYMHIV